MKKPEEAEEMYGRIPGMRAMAEDEVLDTDRPRLAREQQGRLGDSLNLAVKVLSTFEDLGSVKGSDCGTFARMYLRRWWPIARERIQALGTLQTFCRVQLASERRRGEEALALAARKIVLRSNNNTEDSSLRDTDREAHEIVIAFFFLW
ncbi:hypothetical protein OCU04_005985 [Sclerotinia nivalis]|uniref:Uncharacterized protein n=1 Tax=Sclerotinia nivalis TaxID=352851 RepID=A0A9X0AM12_9HELO|nr:hypothetical protein OCU04_005985 [Sclerotinia nivalis]